MTFERDLVLFVAGLIWLTCEIVMSLGGCRKVVSVIRDVDGSTKILSVT